MSNARRVRFSASGRGLRISTAEARRLGLLPDEGGVGAPSKTARAYAARSLTGLESSSKTNPQTLLANALIARLGEGRVQQEVSGLIPGRKYRVDIYIPEARLAVEFDGFQYHRSKSAFQSDRERQNLLVEHGIHVLRFFYAAVRENPSGCADQICRVVQTLMAP